MPNVSNILGKPVNEEKWSEAKKRAEEEGHAGDWDYIMGIYKRMMKVGEFTPERSSYRKDKKMKLSEWQNKHPDWKKKDDKTNIVKKSMFDFEKDKSYTEHKLKLVISDRNIFNDFRCGNCNALLFKGIQLHKSRIEVKCRRCGSLNIN